MSVGIQGSCWCHALVLSVVVCLSAMFAGGTALAAENRLTFSPDGTFKIMQFTDTHLGEVNKEYSEEVAVKTGVELIQDINTLLDAEKPDLVIFTGDNVLHRDLEMWRRLTAPMAQRGIPWAAVLGNHDREFAHKTGREIIEFAAKLPSSLTQCGPDEFGGAGNYVLTVQSAKSGKPAAAFFLMDTGDYTSDSQRLGHYAWITAGQINWFRQQSAALTKANQNVPLPSLVFMHIPVPEYAALSTEGKKLGLQGEEVSSPKINSGFFCAALESDAVMAMFAGHDHDSDFLISHRGVCLAFGRKTGPSSYHHYLPSGARLIELREGQREFTTWIRETNGETKLRTTWPADFPAPKKD